ncbi:23S rRNA (adenine(2503)-C(2))-methyltransferase RlmN [Candidatus Nomurabacteria bacterium]|nr:23S rRNA (adenine(2503)-C(2))-methyltransferase RlmN [Candidatus Nomurabacteria bacterium]
MYKSRKAQIQELFDGSPSFRLKQIDRASFDTNIAVWSEVSTLPLDMRSKLEEHVPWMSVKKHSLYQSKNEDTFKAVLETADKKYFETVLMANSKGQWTICVSSQIGCAMRCNFCATGTMGLKRSMGADEIIDQYRFWKGFLLEHPDFPQRISNVVFMGMGEPLANYENVKEAIHTWLDYTDIGPTKIVVSTVGILPQLKKLLSDPDWPPVRIAISLHSADQKKREEIVPTTVPEFIKRLAQWSHEYQSTLGNRMHHLTFEYTLIDGVNDTEELAHELGQYVKKTAVTKVNVIPLNPVSGKKYTRSGKERVERFKEILRGYDIDVTQRKTMGDDINAACGQLALKSE